MGPDLLDLELKLLMLKHGRGRLLESLAHLEDTTPEQIERLIGEVDLAKQKKRRREPISLDSLVERLGLGDPAHKERILALGREYERGRFLPQLRDVVRFLQRNGMNVRGKSRRELLPRVLSVLAAAPVRVLEEIEDRPSQDGGSFGRLANALMKGS